MAQSKDAATQPSIAIVGAGPAGLAAALESARLGLHARVFEALDTPGGLARTVRFDGYRFDLGGHRFYTKIEEIADLWKGLLGDELLVRPRLSRVYYQGRFFSYPLRPAEALRNLGLAKSLAILASYIRARLRPELPEDNFERWVSNRFGRALYETFFRSYTEKVWGRPCSEIGVEWAAQRIKDLSLGKAILSRLNPFKGTRPAAVSLIEEFLYPRLGPGMMWEACAARARAAGHELLLDTRITRISHEQGRVAAVIGRRDAREEAFPCSHVISTMALADLVAALDPPASAEVRAAASGLKHRDFLTVALVLDSPDLFPDNWIYVHDPAVRVGRVQNFRNWSPDMMPNDCDTVLGLEYFCNEGDELWEAPDESLVSLATEEVRALGLVGNVRIERGVVARSRKAYPVYDPGYKERLSVVRDYLRGFSNLQTCGRSGLHRYNNLDHSMLTGLYAARKVAGGANDVWAVNVGEEYLEADA